MTHFLVSGSLAVVTALPALAGATFQILSPGIANGVSGDGTVVVGQNNSGGFSWTSGGGLQVLGSVAANAASLDGSVIGGLVNNGGSEEAARLSGGIWTPLGGLGPTGCDAFVSSTYGISADGSIVVGLGWDGCSAGAFRWTESDGMVALPQDGPNSARANSISGDGMFVGGWDEGAGGQRRAALWDSNFQETLVLAGQPGNAAGAGEVWGINNDGSIFVGWGTSSMASTNGPFVWRDGDGITYLGNIPGTAPFVSGANDLSDDGSVIVGFQREGIGPFAIFDATIWTEATGTVRLSDYLTALGVTIPAGFQLASTSGISDDGSVLVGWGYSGFVLNQQAWVATLPAARTCAGDFNADGVVDGADLGTLLGAWGPCPGCPTDLNGDGIVDGTDLGLFLSAWGDCS